jgi:hypothetical protein
MQTTQIADRRGGDTSVLRQFTSSERKLTDWKSNSTSAWIRKQRSTTD